jgi:hypothetical protein
MRMILATNKLAIGVFAIQTILIYYLHLLLPLDGIIHLLAGQYEHGNTIPMWRVILSIGCLLQ